MAYATRSGKGLQVVIHNKGFFGFMLDQGDEILYRLFANARNELFFRLTMRLFGRKNKVDPTEEALLADAVAASPSDATNATASVDQNQHPPAAAPATNQRANSESLGHTSVEAANKKNHDRSLYRSLLSGLYDAILILDEKGMILGTNPRVTTLFGHAEDDLWHTPCESLIASMKPAVLQKIRDHAESGRFSVVNASCTRKDGSVFPAEIAMSTISLMNDRDLLLSVRNIERRVQGQNRKARDLVVTDTLATSVVSCRSDGMITSVNPAFLRLSGIKSQQEAVHRFIGDFCESNEMGVQLLLKQQGVGAHWLGEMQFARDDGRKLQVIATTARFVHEDTEQLAITFTPIPRRAALVPAATSG